MTLYTAFDQQLSRRRELRPPMDGVGLLGGDWRSQRNAPFGELGKVDKKRIGEFAELVSTRAIVLGGFATEGLERRYQTHLFGNVGSRLADVPVGDFWSPQVFDHKRRAKNAEAIALLRQWLEADEDAAAEAREWEEFKVSLDADRSSPRKLFP